MTKTFVDKGTPFRRFTARSARSCNRCRKLIQSGASAWKPAENVGSYMPSAAVCGACGDELLKKDAPPHGVSS